jgi:3-hydroxyacyl-[acyl-carrier-protein] dehydratase
MLGFTTIPLRLYAPCRLKFANPSEWRKLQMYNRGFAPAIMDATMHSAPAGPGKQALNIGELLDLLPHRYPMLLIDRVVELVRTKRIVAIKNVTANEPFFAGHFPGYPIMPGVLIIESMAQAGAALLFTEVEDRNDKLLVFTGIERARFRRPVTPGDQLRIEVDVLAFRGTAGRLQGKAYVENKLVCEAVVTCRLLPRKPSKPDAADAGPQAEL